MPDSGTRANRGGIRAALLYVLVPFLLWPVALQAECLPGRVDIRGDWGAASFQVALADEPSERSRGLMFVEEMPQSMGMLFVYETPVSATFWMKNTLIPLDMIFVRPDGVVQHVHAEAIPHDESPIAGGDGVLAVLEINGGLAERMGIVPGSEMRHPAFGADAAWSCDAEDAG